MWIGLGTRMWAGAAAKLPWSPRNAPFSWIMDILLPCKSQESSKKRRVSPHVPFIPCASILADFCAANNLHRICFPLLPTRLSTHGASLFTIVRLIAAFAWLTPPRCLYLSQSDHRTRERRHGDRGNSTIWQSSPPYRFVNRGSTFMDTENFHFSHSKEICMILFPFHTDAPCEPHSSGHMGSCDQGHEAVFSQWSLP